MVCPSPVQSGQKCPCTTVLSVRHARSDERRGDVKKLHFTTDLSLRHARSDERASASSRICILPQFFLSVRHARSDERVARRREKNAFYRRFERPTRSDERVARRAHGLTFYHSLSVRHARSDERVARQRKNFAFYHSDERVVKSTGAIPAPRTEKEYILRLSKRIFIWCLFSSLFL